MTKQPYKRLYDGGRVWHWYLDKGESELVMDLHFFSRGMAYAALTCAIEEV
jgi:hypothetical protein